MILVNWAAVTIPYLLAIFAPHSPFSCFWVKARLFFPPFLQRFQNYTLTI